ncbi:MAG: GNAT family N-acetyltransferase [Cyclobacteriaceae bacterium]
METLTIRTQLKPGDLGYITYLHGKIYAEEYGYGLGFEGYVAESMAEFSRIFDPERGGVWICEVNGRIVGFLSLVNRGDAAQLRYFILEKDFRGKGLGKKLMDMFMERLHSLGYRKAYLMTSNDLPAAAALYRKYGFMLISEEPSDLFGKPIVLQRYELTLP